MTATKKKIKITHESAEYVEFKGEFEKKHYFMLRPPLYYQVIKGEPYGYDRNSFLYDVHSNDELVALWMKDKNKLTYTKQQFIPFSNKNTCPKDVINLFQGFRYNTVNFEIKAKADKKVEIEIKAKADKKEFKKEFCTEWFHEYLSTLVREDPKMKEFIYNFVADIIQNPQCSPNIALVMKGVMGTGKDTLAKIIGNLIGMEYKLTTADFEDIFGRFNSPIKNKIVISIEEVKITASKKHDERMKSLITVPEFGMEEKNKGKVYSPNCFRIIASSNNETPFPIPVGDRRFCVLDVSPKNKGNVEYWNDLHSKIDNERNMNVMYHELLNHHLPKDWNKVNNIPISKCKANMERENIHPLWKMLNENFNVEHPHYDKENAEKWSCNKHIEDVPEGCFYYNSQDFQAMFLEFCEMDESWITPETFKKSRDIDSKLRDCEAIQKSKKRVNEIPTHLRLINGKEIVEYIRFNNLVAHLLDEQLKKQQVSQFIDNLALDNLAIC
jgi:hypothetical protein